MRFRQLQRAVACDVIGREAALLQIDCADRLRRHRGVAVFAVPEPEHVPRFVRDSVL